MRVFTVAPAYLAQRRRTVLAVFSIGTLSLLLVPLMVVAEWPPPRWAIIIALSGATFMVATAAVVGRALLRACARSRLEMDDGGLVWEGEDGRVEMAWPDVTRWRITVAPGGDARRIRVEASGGRDALVRGLDSMREVNDAVESHLGATVQAEVHRQRLDLENPATLAVLVAGALLAGVLTAKAESPIADTAVTLLGLVGVVDLVVRRPFSRHRPRLRWLELTLAVMVGLAIVGKLARAFCKDPFRGDPP